MFLIISFALINILISVFLEKRRYVIAAAAHCIQFIILFLCLLIANGGGVIRSVFVNILGTEAYNIISVALMSENDLSLLTPLLFIQILFCILTVAAALVATVTIIEIAVRIKKEIPIYSITKKDRHLHKCKFNGRPTSQRLYLVNCVMKC